MLDKISYIINHKKCPIRFNWFYDPSFEISEWGSYLNFPVDGYFEPEHIGPIKINQWKWLEIDPIEVIIIGRLVPAKNIDHSLEIINYLNENDIAFSENEKYIRIENTSFIAEI
ncbi:DUF6678 family protein [Aquimarina megaterium]|uniref:DUF6678 family protein n=1 Tax=Aquimarina megaterium TaxID=1443666 RepID=UPI000945D390|nr:DUF6678 family protein [Aquimarina megaterium]